RDIRRNFLENQWCLVSYYVGGKEESSLYLGIVRKTSLHLLKKVLRYLWRLAADFHSFLNVGPLPANKTPCASHAVQVVYSIDAQYCVFEYKPEYLHFSRYS